VRDEGYVVASAGSANTYPGDPLCPPTGTKATFRTCDLYANLLSELPGTPQCELFWPEAHRDCAVARCRDFLEQYGGCFRYTRDPNVMADSPSVEDARFTLRPLKRPATLEDVRRGRAIFSLEGEGGPTRVVQGTRRTAARWTALKDYPVLCRYSDPYTYEPRPVVEYDQSGGIYQVEEVQTAAGWLRYYGFVGRYTVARVPAEEIEFLFYGPGVVLRDRFVCWVESPECPDEPGVTPLEPKTRLGEALPVSVWVFNRTGLDQPAPRFHDVETSSDRPAGAIGCRVRLFRARNSDGFPPVWDARWAVPAFGGMNENRWADWVELKPASPRGFSMPQTERTVGAGTCLNVARWDLSRRFELREPGWYRVEVTFQPGPEDTQGLGSLKEDFRLLDKRTDGR